MCRLTLLLAIGLLGCPTPVESEVSLKPTASAPSAPRVHTGPSGPKAGIIKGGDELQREIGALNKQGLALKDVVNRFVEQNTVNGFLTVDNSIGGTAVLGFVRFHDPVRKEAGKGYLVLTDFVTEDAEAGAFHVVAFWLKDTPSGYRVSAASVQGHPEKQGDRWVRIEHFEVSDATAPPLK